MSRLAYVNGHYIPHDRAAVSIDDRGYQFGDGVYEVVTIINGNLADQDWHLDRLEYSLGALNIPMPMTRNALIIVIGNMIKMNRISYGMVYLQVTRGVMPRDHGMVSGLVPQLVMTAKHLPKIKQHETPAVDVITTIDQRWQRRDIKTIQLLPNCMAKTKASDAAAYEAWMVDDDGFITEGSSSNAWIVDNKGALITRTASNAILSGITRKAILAIAETRNLTIIERPFTPAEVAKASEAFITSATSIVTSVGRIDGKTISDGGVGPVAQAMRNAYFERIEKKKTNTEGQQ